MVFRRNNFGYCQNLLNVYTYVQIFLLFDLEPGFYQDGQFGIRIENLVRVVRANPEHNFNNRGYLTFENLTFVPIQNKMIVAEMLTKEEVSAHFHLSLIELVVT